MKKTSVALFPIILIGVIVIYTISMLLITFIPKRSLLEAVNDAKTTAEDTSVAINVLENDDDRDLTTVTIYAYTQPTHGGTTKSGTTITYMPDDDWNGTDSFTYTIKNVEGETKTATVTITVAPVNDAPFAENDTPQTTKNTSFLIDVLDNDEDADGDTLTIVSVTIASHGVVVIEDNQIRYTPETDFFGIDIFRYYVEDASGTMAEGRVTVRVVDEEADPLGFPKTYQPQTILWALSSKKF